MQWNAMSHGGIHDRHTVEIEVNPNFCGINADRQRGEASSVHQFYRALIQLRHSEAVVATGDFRLLAGEHPALFAFTRNSPEASMLVIGNSLG